MDNNSLSESKLVSINLQAIKFGAVKSAVSICREKSYHYEELEFSTHFFDKDNLEVMYVIHDLVNFVPFTKVDNRIWGKEIFNQLKYFKKLKD